MESFRAEMRKVTGELGKEHQVVPGAVLLSGNKDGPVVQETFGFKSLAADSDPLDLDTYFWVASCTKLVTTVAALQLVERGLVDLDEDITRVLHEWKEPKILVGFDEAGQPITRVAKNKITLRQLLTHSAGMAYSFSNPDLQRYRKAMGIGSSWGSANSIMDVYFDPLLYEPGEGWHYSTSIDWAGVVVERLGGCGTLEQYMSKNIWSPLGMHGLTFHPGDREDIQSNMMQMLNRTNDGGLAVPTGPETSAHFKFDAGGVGLFLKPTEFVKLLSTLLRNDETVLKKDTVEMMFTPQLQDPKYIRAFMDNNPLSYILLRGLPMSIKYNWGLGGLLMLEDAPGRRKAGSMMWGGLPNLSWWIDRESDLYALYSTQLVPPGDKEIMKLGIKFEQALYQDVE
ncbi:beta-lactamase [Dendrothele bispora CBS 962.96]|uniref:Beta-lactamase n=1 Tax=Dendrothele bispora (strain CBS 962.96) TaxID=1314807 RepID=A0A4S8MZL8_DENBC|nr:beta-lactamase [Dendrothele bispora CBS 962.96]